MKKRDNPHKYDHLFAAHAKAVAKDEEVRTQEAIKKLTKIANESMRIDPLAIVAAVAARKRQSRKKVAPHGDS